MPRDTTTFSRLVTSEHADKTQFVETVALLCQPALSWLDLADTFPTALDIDTALGSQLDLLGEWIGFSRKLSSPITGVYFAFDTSGVGFNAGVWLGPFDPVSGLVSLPDEQYRLLLKAKVLNNQWRGDIPSAYQPAAAVFTPLGYQMFIVDHNDLTMDLGLVGSQPPDALTWELFTGGYFDLKPAGVRIAAYLTQTVSGPLFAFDLSSTTFGGFDVGGWALITEPA